MKVSGSVDYDAVFRLKHRRTVQDDYTISYDGGKIELAEAALRAVEKVEVRAGLDRSVHVCLKDKPVKARTILRRAG